MAERVPLLAEEQDHGAGAAAQRPEGSAPVGAAHLATLTQLPASPSSLMSPASAPGLPPVPPAAPPELSGSPQPRPQDAADGVAEALRSMSPSSVPPGVWRRVGRDALLVRVCSWNVGEAEADELPQATLLAWLLGEAAGPPPKWAERPLDQPDIVAVGLQEVDMSCGSMLWACCGRSTARGAAWRRAVHGALAHRGYDMLCDRQLGGLQLLLFARRAGGVLPEAVELSTIASGFCCGTCWNKGTASCRVVLPPPPGSGLDPCSICFVNSHFAAKAAKLERRNWEHDRVCGRTRFRRYPHTIHEHDAVLWFGDLNYRLDYPQDEYAGRTRKEVKAALRQESLDPGTSPQVLVDKCDQLAQQIRVGRVFSGYNEARIDFRPTYKVLPGKERHDMRRQPSYTDRVLFYVRNDDGPEDDPTLPGARSGVSGMTPESLGSGFAPGGINAKLDNSPPQRMVARGRQVSKFEPLPALLSMGPAEQPAASAGSHQCRVLCVEYSATEDMPIADHRPVHALFAIPGRLPASSAPPGASGSCAVAE
eukprot:TRINITY_DN9212_c0_g1_i1.p1 TRINITY_DN9212_c0_g1~~TRINITY_DN9212_c0_g1_i1.p1  ORF type:complete len:537 (+),score=139.63 TRINITY_DN9212_c0_g1_i1:111-1721(+)